ncbi:MAG: hypothetical protein GY952_15180 [Rhodobacteraceae bacterium]|nr:hypothetical protein [Paracoccaceae bacterium]
MTYLKSIFLAVIAVILTATNSFADNLGGFRQLIESGKVAQVEQLLADLDQAVIDNGYSDNNKLRDRFRVFETTHPDYVRFLTDWSKANPNSIYQKTAMGWHLNHLGWITRGPELARHTHPDAFEQMHRYFDHSTELAWDVFKQRNDFVPASDLVATHYLHNRGEWPMHVFVWVAMDANTSLGLLEKIVYAYNPKWGGSWDEVKNLCERYAHLVEAADWYNADACRVTAVYDSISVYRGRDKEVLEWAQNQLDTTPDDTVVGARWKDSIYLRFDKATPEFMVQNFNPANDLALNEARVIEDRYGVRGFTEVQVPKIIEAEKRSLALDPLNPDKLETVANKLVWGNKMWEDPQAREQFLSLTRDRLVYGHYRPKNWLAQVSSVMSGPEDYVSVLDAREFFEKAIVLSNYRKRYLGGYFYVLSHGYRQLSTLRRNGSMKLYGETIDAQALFEEIKCPTVQAARLFDHVCPADEVMSRECRAEGFIEFPSEFLAEAERNNICPAKLYSPIEELNYEVTPNL